MRWAIVACSLIVGCGGQVDQPETPDTEPVDSAADADMVETDLFETSVPVDTSVDTSVADATSCPPLVPKSAGECPSLGLACDYTTSCGGAVHAHCETTGWSVDTVTACMCPPSPRGFITPCDTAMKCEYDGACGKITSECAGPGSHWSSSMGMCMGGGSCPAKEPAVGDACTASGKCSYDTKCGGETIYCDSTGYTLAIDYAHCPGCPEKEPTEGASCGSGVSCWYASACGKRDEANCMGGTWKVTRPDCSK